jgi:RNA polymerase sigma factor (sigma-70 family)
LTEAEQNRLVTENMGLVPVIAADFRGRGIDFEDLLAIGREGLTQASRTFEPEFGKFSAWASIKIRSRIQDEWKSGSHHLLGEEPDSRSLGIEKIYEWDAWGHMGNALAIYEQWPDTFDGSPEALIGIFDEIKDKRHKFNQAFISLTPLERKLVTLTFLRDPALSLAETSRELRISYKRCRLGVERGLRKMRGVISRMTDPVVV